MAGSLGNSLKQNRALGKDHNVEMSRRTQGVPNGGIVTTMVGLGPAALKKDLGSRFRQVRWSRPGSG